MSNVKYRKTSKTVNYGKYEEVENNEGYIVPKVIKSIDLHTFYTLYIKLNNVIGTRRMGEEEIETTLAPAPIELLVHLMMKDENFTIVFRNKDASLINLGKELNKTASSIYATLSKLRKTGYIIVDEDSMFILNHELRDLVSMVRKHIRDGKPLLFDYIFKFCIENK